MAKKTSKSVVGTSFYYSTVNTTYNKLAFVLGNPQISQNTGRNNETPKYSKSDFRGGLFLGCGRSI